ncbi:hypothetical protein J6590_106677 [Homalodisca vitripennis]|nr:hypothetical protein J6590_106677 [Homalodisca vitripennis]
MPMDTVCRVLSSCMVHKILTIEEPQYLRERLLYRDQVSQRASRHGGNLHLPRVNLELGRKSFSYFGPKLYNDLPDGLKGLMLGLNSAQTQRLHAYRARS